MVKVLLRSWIGKAASVPEDATVVPYRTLVAAVEMGVITSVKMQLNGVGADLARPVRDTFVHWKYK